MIVKVIRPRLVSVNCDTENCTYRLTYRYSTCPRRPWLQLRSTLGIQSSFRRSRRGMMLTMHQPGSLALDATGSSTLKRTTFCGARHVDTFSSRTHPPIRSTTTFAQNARNAVRMFPTRFQLPGRKYWQIRRAGNVNGHCCFAIPAE